MKYVPPEFEMRGFSCPHCGAFANMQWSQMLERGAGGTVPGPAASAWCSHCGAKSVWLSDPQSKSRGLMIWPVSAAGSPLAHEAMPPDVKADYEEARTISGLSSRGAAALLRLCVQKLCKHLGEAGNNINDDIASLVKKGLSVEIQRALDAVRVVGNNAVHPGEMQLQEDPAIVLALFGLLNLIVESRIAEPARVKQLFDALPEKARAGIARRDGA